MAVFNEDRKTELIGEAWIDLKGVIIPGGGQKDIWHSLNYKGKYAGEIRVEFTYYDTRSQQEPNDNRSHDIKSRRSKPILNEFKREPRHQTSDTFKLRPLSSDTLPKESIPGDSSGSSPVKYVSLPILAKDHRENKKRYDGSSALNKFDHLDHSSRIYPRMLNNRPENEKTDLRRLRTTLSTDTLEYAPTFSRTGYQRSDLRSPQSAASLEERRGKTYIVCSNSNSPTKKQVGDELCKSDMEKQTSRSWPPENDPNRNRERLTRHSVTQNSTVQRDQNTSDDIKYNIPINIPPRKSYATSVDSQESPPPPPIHRNLNMVRKAASQDLYRGQCSDKNASHEYDPRCKNLHADDERQLSSYNIHNSYQGRSSERHRDKHQHLLNRNYNKCSSSHCEESV